MAVTYLGKITHSDTAACDFGMYSRGRIYMCSSSAEFTFGPFWTLFKCDLSNFVCCLPLWHLPFLYQFCGIGSFSRSQVRIYTQSWFIIVSFCYLISINLCMIVRYMDNDKHLVLFVTLVCT